MPSRTALRWASGVAVLLTAIGWDLSVNRDELRCKDHCFGAAASSRFGSSTNEPGHPWTNYATSWQWEAQNILAHVAVVAAIVALALAVTDARDPRKPLGLAVVTLVGWTAWLILSPSPDPA